jgi:hypothetical protein
MLTLIIALIVMTAALDIGYVIFTVLQQLKVASCRLRLAPLQTYTHTFQTRIIMDSGREAALWKSALNRIIGIGCLPIAVAVLVDPRYCLLICPAGFLALVAIFVAKMPEFPRYILQIRSQPDAPSAYKELAAFVAELHLGNVWEMLPYFAGLLALYAAFWYSVYGPMYHLY